ncbi:tRNA 4-thiouridine(8) synthase ThiI [Halopseudomonas nanhaiensis]|uniref:tRNA uracil 4-sulfurtransferase ThiI n=1 Tax=Halopseudomonas nanhaiensis TaxID=2830842 RepID=UPI001CBB04C7|nr:tRNA uracil 4-sulfurtransferase ThiI [Halopseudomonas nanhaiensis]UAW98218.1 tRNA 4-thiouridine(8) synthase ThiI [Halopseudomonas nanhaiensis]
MKLIIKFFPEITIKTRPVRKRFIQQLKGNLKTVLKAIDPEARVSGNWDFLEVSLGTDPAVQKRCIERLRNTPGIAHFVEVHDYQLESLEQLADLCVANVGDQIRGKVFAVRCKRVGTHPFSSPEAAAFLGSALVERCGAAGVSLKNPEVWVDVELRDQRVLLIQARHKGMGGFPLGTQEPVLCLLSGGFDSTVAAYSMLQRGLLPHFIFFNMGGRAHELGVRQVAHYMWERYASSHRLRFISVPFEGVVGELLKNIDNPLMGVVLKRMMLRAANRVAWRLGLDALVTGEAIAQVASQTLPNLRVIDEASDLLVLRPLITTSKTDIISTARAIGTEGFASSMPEYCGIISVNPAIRTTPNQVEAAEANFDLQILDAAIAAAGYHECQELDQPMEGISDVELVDEALTGQIVIDIRHPDEQEQAPFAIEGVEVKAIPFYELSTRFKELDPARNYLLYCQKGIMSQMHAQTLADAGHGHVRVLRPR